MLNFTKRFAGSYTTTRTTDGQVINIEKTDCGHWAVRYEGDTDGDNTVYHKTLKEAKASECGLAEALKEQADNVACTVIAELSEHVEMQAQCIQNVMHDESTVKVDTERGLIYIQCNSLQAAKLRNTNLYNLDYTMTVVKRPQAPTSDDNPIATIDACERLVSRSQAITMATNAVNGDSTIHRVEVVGRYNLYRFARSGSGIGVYLTGRVKRV